MIFGNQNQFVGSQKCFWTQNVFLDTKMEFWIQNQCLGYPKLICGLPKNNLGVPKKTNIWVQNHVWVPRPNKKWANNDFWYRKLCLMIRRCFYSIFNIGHFLPLAAASYLFYLELPCTAKQQLKIIRHQP